VRYLRHPEDLDRLQDQVDGGGAEDAGHRDHQPELEPAAPVETRQIEAEELLPEGVVPGLDGNQLVEDGPLGRGGDPVQRPVEGEIEQLVQDEPAAQPEVGRGLGHGGICYTFRERGARRRRRR
jgi:hypothetical protein